jgi:Omp85 superfamily domain
MVKFVILFFMQTLFSRGSRIFVVATIFFVFNGHHIAYSQETMGKKEARKALLKDTLDGKFDFSSFLLKANGFLPIPMIITEPALGDFGGLLALTFFSPKKVTPEMGYVPPDITALAGMVTANGTWLVGGGRIGSFPKAGLKYRAFAGYADANLDFYRDLPSGEEQKLAFNIQAAPILLNLSKKVSKSDLYLGVQYSFAKSAVEFRSKEELPEIIPEADLDSKIGSFGLFADWDKRDNFFTPSKGVRLNLLYSMDDDWTGSDYQYQKLSSFANVFIPFSKHWISGFRFDYQQVYDKPPFYLYPFLNMRGVPMAKYQGATTTLAETEQRYDFSRRWSAVAFGGLGKAVWENQSFADADLVYNYGAGFRYLMARAFGLRAGIDVAGGPGSFGWYITVGHNWNR